MHSGLIGHKITSAIASIIVYMDMNMVCKALELNTLRVCYVWFTERQFSLTLH